MKSSIFFFIFSIFLFADYLEFSVGGYINWSNGKVYGIGYGVPNPKMPKNIALFGARRAAILDAKRNLLETIGGVRIDSSTTIKNGMLINDTIKTTIAGVVKNASVVSIKNEYSMVKAIVEAPINGSILKVVYPETTMSDIKALLNKNYAFKLNNYLLASLDNDKILKNILERLNRLEKIVFYDNKIKKNKITGIIIDARGTNFIPTLTPKIYQIKTATPMYPDGVVDKETIVSSFAALFVNNLNDAYNHPKVGSYPIVLKALRTYGKWRNRLVLGKNDSKKFKKFLNTNVLKEAHVVIVISR